MEAIEPHLPPGVTCAGAFASASHVARAQTLGLAGAARCGIVALFGCSVLYFVYVIGSLAGLDAQFEEGSEDGDQEDEHLEGEEDED